MSLIIINYIKKILVNIFHDINQYKYLWIFIYTYSLCILLANFYDSRLIEVFGVTTTAGVLVYPISFSINLLIAEVYSFYYSKKTILIGFLTNIPVILYGALVIIMPIPEKLQHDIEIVNNVFARSILIMVASLTAYFVSEFTNSLIYTRLKDNFKSSFITTRYYVSIFTANIIDTIIFVIIAFGFYLDMKDIMKLIVVVAIIKFTIEGILGIFFHKVSKKIKAIENIKEEDQLKNFSLLRKKYGKK